MTEAPHRCLVMVHGIGTQQRGETLADVGEPLAAFISGYVCTERETGVTADVAPNAAGDAGATVRFRDGGSERELWLHEVWWSPRYAPPSFSPVALWTLRVFWSQLRAIGIGLIHPDRGRGSHTGDRPGVTPQDAVVYGPVPRGVLARLYDAAIGFALLVVFVLGAGPVFAVLLLAWLFDGLYGLIRLNGLSAMAAALREKVFTQHVSQVYLYLNSNLARASIRAAAEEVLRPRLTSKHRHQERCEGLTIVAHSWGTVVALDALHSLAHDGTIDHGALTLITVGSALNRARALKPDDPLWQEFTPTASGAERAAGDSWCNAWRWINLWARFDPVSAGPISSALRAAIGVPEEQLHDQRVSNLDDPIGDHTGYWANVHEVTSRILFEANGCPSRGSAAEATGSAIAAIGSRRRAVGLLAVGRLIAIAASGVLAVLLVAANVGQLQLASLIAPAVLAVYLIAVDLLMRRPSDEGGVFWTGLVIVAALVCATAIVAAAGAVYTAPESLDALPIPANLPPFLAGFVPLVALYKLLRYVVLDTALTTLPDRGGKSLPRHRRRALSRAAFTWDAGRWR